MATAGYSEVLPDGQLFLRPETMVRLPAGSFEGMYLNVSSSPCAVARFFRAGCGLGTKKGLCRLAKGLLYLEPAKRFELLTCGLRISCSTTELRRLIQLLNLTKQNGAGDGVRTRGLRLGKPTFYH
jgi:hypothetical protein